MWSWLVVALPFAIVAGLVAFAALYGIRIMGDLRRGRLEWAQDLRETIAADHVDSPSIPAQDRHTTSQIHSQIEALSRATSYGNLLLQRDRIARKRAVLEDAQKRLGELVRFLNDTSRPRTDDYITDLRPTTDTLAALMAGHLCKIIDCAAIKEQINRHGEVIKQQSKMVDYRHLGFASDSYFIAYHTQKTRVETFLEAVNAAMREISLEEEQCSAAIDEAIFIKD